MFALVELVDTQMVGKARCKHLALCISLEGITEWLLVEGVCVGWLFPLFHATETKADSIPSLLVYGGTALVGVALVGGVHG